MCRIHFYNMKNLDIATDITDAAISHFGDKLNSVLLYGSSLSARRKPNDLDIIVILKGRETPEDLSFLRSEREKYHLEIDLQIINILDIDPDSFSHDTHGQFVIAFLQKAYPLYGKNPFLGLFPRYSKRVTSVLQKTQYYYFRAKKIQANNNHPGGSRDLSFHRKKILLMLADFWLVYSGRVCEVTDKDMVINIITVLTKNRPSSDELKFLMRSTSSFAWEDIFRLYQKYYYAILDLLRPRIKRSPLFVGDIHSDFYDIGSHKLAVIASGCPSDYNEDEIAQFLTIRGFNVVTFHYSATGRSKGVAFRDPQLDIVDVVNHYEKLHQYIIAIGNSYGGYPVLAASSILNNVDRFIAVSPVVDFKKIKDISTLPHYLSVAHSGYYRFKEEDFEKFIQVSQKLHNIRAEKVSVIHGELDEQINILDIKKFCKEFLLDSLFLETGHISLNRLTRENLDALDEML